MRHLFNILLFFLYCSGLGYLFTSFIRRITWDSFLLQIAVGLGSIPVIGVLFHVLNIPLEVRIFLCLAIIGIFLFVGRASLKRDQGSVKRKEVHIWIVLAVFLIQAFIYCGGAFRYPYLEDDDPWGHASGIKYIAVEKNLTVDPGQFHYINPYPPGYDIVFALLHQTHPSLYWTMKFFNGLIVSLGFLFFYLFAKELTGDKTKAVIATLILSATPCYLSHFIWAHALAVTLFFPTLTCLLKCRKDRRYIIPGAVLMAGIFLTQPTQSLKFMIMVSLLILAIILATKKTPKNISTTCLIAGAISLLWWGPILHSIHSGASKIALRDNDSISGYSENTAQVAKGLFSPKGGSATQTYSLRDYMWPPSYSNQFINNPIGIGLGICLLAFLGLFYLGAHARTGPPQTKLYFLTVIFWLIFTFLGMNSATFNLPVGLFAFRFWMLLAIPVAFLAAEGFGGIYQSIAQERARNLAAALSFTVLILFSGYPKVVVNTSFWPSGTYWHSTRELRGYLWLRVTLKSNTRVFSYSDNLLVIGHDMRCDFWTKDYNQSFNQAFRFPPIKLYNTLKSHKFEYMIVGLREMKNFGEPAMKYKLKELEESGLFKTVYSLENGVIVFQLV